MDLKSEGIHTEYKKAQNSIPKDFWETYSAFANTDGGTVYFGITEDPKGTFNVSGVKDPQKIIVELNSIARNANKVSKNLLLESNINVINIDNKPIVTCYIPSAPRSDKPIYLHGNTTHSYIRFNESDNLMTPTELQYFISEAGNSYDGDIAINYGIDDLNLSDVSEYRSILANREGTTVLDESLTDFLKSLGILKRDRNSGSDELFITSAGLLFFGKYNSITERFPGFQLNYMEKSSSTDSDYIDRIVTDNTNDSPQNLFSFYRRLENKLSAKSTNPFQLDSSFTREDTGPLFLSVLREALANALSHAYYKSNRGVNIMQYPEYFEFINPGSMRVSIDQFVHGGITDPRNPQIVLLFRRAGLVERGGTGGRRIFNISDKLKLRTPTVSSENEETLLRIWKSDIANSYSSEYDESSPVTKLLKMLDTNGPLKSSELKPLFATNYEYQKTIKELLSKNIIEKFGKSVATRYRLKVTDAERAKNMNKLIRDLEDTLLNRD